MARKLTEKDISTIVGIIDGWKGKLTYEKLIAQTVIPLKQKYSRQSLFAHVRIRGAYDNRKNSLRNGSPDKQVKSVELQKALERIKRLEATNQRLEMENEALLSQFVRWATNAHSKGLTLDFLNMSMTDVDRRATKTKESKNKVSPIKKNLPIKGE